MSIDPLPRAVPAPESRIHGTLLGGALGDSLGYAVEFEDINAIRERYGAEGLQGFAQLDGNIHFSDDTQMTLYTVDGLVEALEWANSGVGADVNACLWLSYLRWLSTQRVEAPANAPVPQPRWIDAQEVLHHRRSPGNACLTGLATGEMGTIQRPVNPESKGCGTVMRSAPFGLIPHISAEAAYKLSSDAASLTHGHPSARQTAGLFSLLIHALVAGSGVADAARWALGFVQENTDPAPELVQRITTALRLAGHDATNEPGATGGGRSNVLTPEELVSELGEGWVAEEALAVALYAVLATEQEDPKAHFKAAVTLAVNHSGDSDSTGSIAGNILGAFYGEECLPPEWLAAVEAPEVIRGMAERLVAVTLA
jgi:ADP-ribosylglycohydrolase